MRRVSLRAMRANCDHSTRPMMATMFVRLGPTSTPMSSAIRIIGSEIARSTTRIKMASSHPPT